MYLASLTSRLGSRPGLDAYNSVSNRLPRRSLPVPPSPPSRSMSPPLHPPPPPPQSQGNPERRSPRPSSCSRSNRRS